MDRQRLKENPFFLKDEDIDWVESTLGAMSRDEKIGQLFHLIAYSSDEGYLKSLISTYKPSGVMCRPMDPDEVVSAVSLMQESSAIPLLVSANLEKGGVGVVNGGTSFGSPMMTAATGDPGAAGSLGRICAEEGRAAGVNWSFGPIIDIDYNFRNPITNTRTFGSDPDFVRESGEAYVRALQEEGLAASIKHFPGDGRDERDQHLVASVNDMNCEEWEASYGSAYRACIEAGAKTVMAAHIMLPSWSRRLNPNLSDSEIMPATLAPELLEGLLRKQLGFNGLIISDASTMAGMNLQIPRSEAVPLCIAAGCDSFLFTKNIEEDYGFMKAGVENGMITPRRLDEAVTRILALKASLGLHDGSCAVPLRPDAAALKKTISDPEHRRLARECAEKGITLVKEEPGVLPLSPGKHKRVLLYAIEGERGMFNFTRENMSEKIKSLLESEGFEVTLYEPSAGMEGMTDPVAKITDNYDLLLYIANLATKSNQTSIRIEWAMPMGANVPVYGHTVPTVFISLENPYHLLDVPRVKTYINTYGSTDEIITSLMDKLTGKSPFTGVSPSDPFCGRWDTRL